MQNGQPSNGGNCLVCILYPTVQAIDVIVTAWHHLTVIKSSHSVCVVTKYAQFGCFNSFILNTAHRLIPGQNKVTLCIEDKPII